MLFMAIFTYEPEKRDAVVKRRSGKGPLLPDGAKIIGEWSSIAGGRAFRVLEIDDAAAALAATRAWSDLGKVEMVPIIVTEDALKADALKVTLGGF